MQKNKIISHVKKVSQLAMMSPAFTYRSARQRMGWENKPSLYYIVPDVNWVTDWIGHYLTVGIREQFEWSVKTTSTPHLLIDHILHYDTLGSFLSSIETPRNQKNTIIATVFHGNLTGESPKLAQNIEKFLGNMHQLTKVVTACRIMEDRFLDWGVPAEKIIRIPLGIDLAIFTPVTEEQKQKCRQRLNIPENVFCIGSFQKDGNGWGSGLTPKLVKGPDVFLDTMQRVYEQHKNLFVLLTGPARGYMKRGLDALGIPYQHYMLSNYHDVAKMYHCLDMYLVASREEGGPKAVLEALATGVPLVSTRVGLAPDIIQHNYNGLLAEVDDTETLVKHILNLVAHKELGERLSQQGLKTITAYDWVHISSLYYKKLYVPILQSI